MDLLYDHYSQLIEKNIFFHTANLFNLKVDLIFYDTTTASFSIDQEDDDSEALDGAVRKFDRGKEGTWSPQVVVALAVTREGLPVRCWVFPGNTTDVNTVEKVRSDLRGWSLGRACGKYLLACRMASVSEIKRDVLSKRGRYRVIKDNLQAKEVVIGDG